MIPCLSQVCSLNSPFDKDVADYAAGACRAMEVWLTKLEAYLEQHTVDDVRRLLEAHQISLPVASYQGGLLSGQDEALRETGEHFRRRLRICQELGIATMVVSGDFAGDLNRQHLEQAKHRLSEAADRAAEHNVRLAFEFQGRSAFANNIQTAVALVAECNDPNLGLCFDVFHYYTGPSKHEDLGYLTDFNLFHVQLSDLSGQLRETATDSDRILPGDGDFLLGPLIDSFREIGYRGHVSVELMNPKIWQIPALQFGEVGMTALRKVLGQAAME